jgi:hypothetical protein
MEQQDSKEIPSTVIKGFCKGCGANFDLAGDYCKCPVSLPRNLTEEDRLKLRVRRLEEQVRAERQEAERLREELTMWRRVARRGFSAVRALAS